MLIDLVTLIMLFAYTLMYHLLRIKCIVTYDLYGLISHKSKTITSDVLRTWSPYILNYGQINIMAKKPRLELLSRLRILQNVNEIFDYILSYISCKPRHVYGPFSRVLSHFLIIERRRVLTLVWKCKCMVLYTPTRFYSFDNILTIINV